MKGIQYIVDDKGDRKAVLIDLKKYASLWEDFCDSLVAQARAREPRESLDAVKKHLKHRRLANA